MESDVIMPNSDQTAALEPGKLYVHLFHGRKTPDEKLDDWGSEGPMIGPLDYVHVTYMGDVKFAAAPAVMDRFFPRRHEELADVRLCECGRSAV